MSVYTHTALGRGLIRSETTCVGVAWVLKAGDMMEVVNLEAACFLTEQEILCKHIKQLQQGGILMVA